MDYMKILKNRYVQMAACVAAGITLGTVFYPQSRVEERYKSAYEKKEIELREQHTLEKLQLNEKHLQEEKTYIQRIETSTQKINSLTTENTNLKQSIKKKKFKIIKPDGTIIEKEFEESNSEATASTVTQVKAEFDRQVSVLEEKWKKVHEERVVALKKEFDEKLLKAKSEVKIVEREKIVEVNKKSFRPEIGVTTEKNAYLHGTYEVWGPVFLGAGITGNKEEMKEGRIGIGVSL
jgi:hypothetical protein